MNLTIDQMPNVRAFVSGRIAQIKDWPDNPIRTALLAELESIVAVCDGLAAQNDFLKSIILPTPKAP